MTHVRVTVDGMTMMDDNLGNWQARPPEFLKRMVTPGPTKPESHIKAIGIVIADAVLIGEDVAIDVTTDKTDRSWSMSVQHSFAIALPGPTQ